MLVSESKIVYCAFGPAAEKSLAVLLGTLHVPKRNIMTLTYESEENAGFLRLLAKEGMPFLTESINSQFAHDKIQAFSPDIVVSMHYRDLIPTSVLRLARRGGINLHPSLLPKYRGCFSSVWAILNQEQETGISYHYMNQKYDDGNIILQATTKLSPEDTGFSLFHRLIDLGVANFAQAMRLALEEELEGSPQTGEPSYYKRALPFDGVIDPAWPADRVDAFIRAMNFPGKPGARLRTENGIVEVDSIETYNSLTGRLS